MTHDAMLELCFDLASRAGEAIMAVRARGFETTYKGDLSPVTEADQAAERIIADGLRAALPGAVVVAEEEIAAGHVPDAADAYWLVDPLDGTREFVAGGTDFAVCIGLVEAGIPVLGVVAAPAEGEMFGGIVGRGAWVRDRDGTRPVQARALPAEGAHVVASRRHGTGGPLETYLAAQSVSHVTNVGSAVKFCRVAAGVADLYPRFGRTMEWDTAAGQALLEAAGGRVVVAETGETLRYGKSGWENPSFICTGAP